MARKPTRKTRRRSEGLRRALEAAGGPSNLARLLGITQPSVSNWTEVPLDRLLAVEKVTGVSRRVLRPDLFRKAA